MQKKALCLLFIPLLLFLFVFPQDSFQASCAGVMLWFQTVLPSLLPFIILSNLLLHTGLIEVLLRRLEPLCCTLLGLSACGAYAWTLGILCGFPMGAKLTSDLYTGGRISQDEAEYLLTISNHASPMFIITFVVLQTLGDSRLLKPVLCILYGSALLSMVSMRIVHRRFGHYPSPCDKKEVSKTGSPGIILDTSIMNGFEIITRLGGYIILFSIYSAMLRKILMPFPMLQAVMAGITEITTGITCIHQSLLPEFVKFSLILVCTSFGGISTLAQTNCVVQESGLSIRTYLSGKLLNGCITLALVLFVFILF